MKNIKYLLFFIILTSCGYFNVSPVNGIDTNDLTSKPKESEMVGIWEVDKFSYDLILKREYENKKIE